MHAGLARPLTAELQAKESLLCFVYIPSICLLMIEAGRRGCPCKAAFFLSALLCRPRALAIMAKAFRSIETGKLVGRGQPDFRKLDTIERFGIACTVFAGGDSDMVDHLPFYAVFSARERSYAFALEP